jgi:hypothetical protein
VLTKIADVDAKKALYECGCGVRRVLWKSNVRPGHTQSCGCLRRAATAERSTTHGHKADGKRSRVYVAWMNMKGRCYNRNRKDYPDYGGRGIVVCDRWKDSFENFLADMGEPPAGGTLGRKENDGPYEPGNCRWETSAEQSLNKRNSHRVEAFGKSLTISEWATETGIGYVTLLKRLQRGVPPEAALGTTGYLKVNRK